MTLCNLQCKRIGLAGFAILFLFGLSCCTYNSETDPIQTAQVITDSLFNSKQRVNLLKLDKKYRKKYSLSFGYQETELMRTSEIAKNRGAVAAINGSFFDVDSGGSVTYFEMDDSVINRTRSSELKWAVPDSLANGAIILSKLNKLVIEAAQSEHSYEKSRREKFVMVTGPLLISQSEPQRLPHMRFTNNRHPRTCLGITKESIIFITIDGRSDSAAGMTLFELRDYLLELGCTDAINLDGGGSTTLWTKDNGIVNIPSDKKGERPVANAILIVEK